MLKYKLANRNKLNYLLTPVFKEENSEQPKSKDAEAVRPKLLSRSKEGDR